MKLEEFENRIAVNTFERREKRRIRNFAETLSHIGQVPEGQQLVELIGDGHERDNTEALCTWVRKELKRCTLDEPNQLDYLYARLLQTIEFPND